MLSADVKEVLYSVIDGIGRGKIRMEVSADVAASKRYCEEITEKCVNALGSQTDDETLGTLCEALLHFMLTASLLPSDRKVTIDGIEVSVVIPSVKSLAKDPSKSLVIQVVKDGTVRLVREAEKVQPIPDNLWAVSARPIDTGHRNYALKGRYPLMISDVRAFLQDKGVSSLKMLHG